LINKLKEKTRPHLADVFVEEVHTIVKLEFVFALQKKWESEINNIRYTNV